MRVDGIDRVIPGWMGVAWLIEVRRCVHRDLAVPTMGSGLMSEAWIVRYVHVERKCSTIMVELVALSVWN